MWLSLVFVFVLVLYTVVLAFKNRKKLSDKMIVFIAIFAFIPVLISFIQLFVYGLILTWAVVALGIVFAYYLIEISGNSIDYLTGLFSRKKIEEILRGKIERENAFTVVLMDLDYFKNINDKYGHKTGDETLIHFANILRNVFSKENFISRLGGDEFLIVSDVTEIDAVNQFKLEIINEMRTYKSFEIIKELSPSIVKEEAHVKLLISNLLIVTSPALILN